MFDENVEKLKEWLSEKRTIQELKAMAKNLGLKVKRMMKKKEVIKLLESYIKQNEEIKKLERPSSSTSASDSIKKEDKLSKEELYLPKSYNKNKLVLMPVNPNWLHAYWDYTKETFETLNKLPKEYRIVLRIYDVTFIEFTGNNAHRTFEIRITPNMRNYYINVPIPNADYLAEIGYITPDGNFYSLIRSNVCKTPPNSPSNSTREKWLDLRKKRKIVTPSDGVLVKEVETIPGSIFKIEEIQNKSEQIWELFSKLRSGRGI
ncbi:hypothetical protein SU69_01765 [Thermosipho melanesiensis]|uniref:Uncharacterized protein-like protein n=2 Tax=Thermosipho melanesiensis TaxID=46541 RepID=A6LJV7_THEM4|nr:DUF4912 domain-containing protein [Thermosipho melanesiensis]ABR30208.1 Uncharacterized protein-like protein [Thermosipho melanesiensis BI429]APT73406.1 hypothetical protein BW47_01820 [Thermosipho melanesiensis]OOC38219.1 hypothetical protein SU68_01775 [Thermosipho melanesiensis]OOC40048.1 hypothetical protein SU69_01765 [Thermosipho melanesiensis]OOC40068.1 hypothetical protein SU70_01760 [Thermosipho melanesiensis]